MRRIWKSIWEAESAMFVSRLPLQEAMRSLAAIVERSELANWGADCLVGRVSSAHVCIARHRGGQRMPTRPVFLGKFQERSGQTVLEGRFTYPWSTRLLLMGSIVVLVIFVLASAILGAVSLVSNGRSDVTVWVAVAMLVSAAVLATTLFKVTQPFEREDIAWISERVDAAIGSA